MRCVIYSRVSTEEQSTDNQLRQLREYADRQGWNVVEEIRDIASGGKSAEERQGLKKVFIMARQRKFDVLLFWSLDRFSREGSRKTLEYLTRLDSYHTKWHSYTEEYISSLGIFSDAIISLMACLAKQERIRISERTKAGLARVKAKGKVLGRPTDVIADTEQIRELRQSGYSLSEISQITGVSKTRVHRLLSA
ncbi:recombinase family protein [Victivallaceae bacterium BBE-744-WT-12]|uniref:Recombinase family protein n=1 Tax=Victivallis lenta TaxID=2606640 RepID=A0A844G7T7_9BACT|nr:recombinase family protein [Victivallis lenta]AVM45618.1 resolvase [Victivallales bacterium CCUG 44730]MST98508.1 recombinase family protein [Victivallis lenta]